MRGWSFPRLWPMGGECKAWRGIWFRMTRHRARFRPVYGRFRRRRYSARALARVRKAHISLFSPGIFPCPPPKAAGTEKYGIVRASHSPGVNAGPEPPSADKGHKRPSSSPSANLCVTTRAMPRSGSITGPSARLYFHQLACAAPAEPVGTLRIL
jgi:hypothetical protein